MPTQETKYSENSPGATLSLGGRISVGISASVHMPLCYVINTRKRPKLGFSLVRLVSVDYNITLPLKSFI